MIEVKNLTKRYGDIKALDDISFTVDTGEVLGFLGPNGAGKSTTMNIITGYISSTSGTVTVDGTEILENPRETKRKIGYLPEIPPLYPEMTVRKYLEFMFKQIIEIRKLIRSLGKKHTVIFSSHVLSEISATCDRIIVISEGRLVADSKADELSKALADTQKLSLTVEGSPSDVLGEIKKIPGVKKYMKVRELGEKSAVYSVEYGNEFDIRREVFSAMARINAPILEMKSGNESLEDMFLKLTQGAGKAGR